jgi:hypothetical protein
MRAGDVARLVAPLIAVVLACASPEELPSPRPVAPVTAPEAEGWTEIHGSLFTLTTDVPRSRAQAFTSELELFIALVKRVTGEAVFPEEPLQIFVFARDADFERYRLEPNQGGLFIYDGQRSFALISGSDPSMETRQKLFHEFTHYLMSAKARVREYPLWYNEGLAEMLSSVAWKDGSAIVGLPPARIAGARALGRWIPLESLLSAHTSSGMSPEDADLFYAEAWALVHHLHTAKHGGGADRYPQMLDYLQRVRGGSDWREAANRAFGATLDDLEVELRRHWLTPVPQLLGLRVDLSTLAPATSGLPRTVPQAEVDARLSEAEAVLAMRGAPPRLDPPFEGPFDGGSERSPSRSLRPEIEPPEVDFPQIELPEIEVPPIEIPDLPFGGAEEAD